MSKDAIDFKAQLFDQLGRISRALASPRRLELVDLLAQAEHTVEELARHTGMSVANTSRHLQALRHARLVSVRRSGVFAHYGLADPGVFRVWQAVRDLGEARLAEVRMLVRARHEAHETDALTLEDLRRRVDRGDSLLLDVRPEREYRAGHLPGALNIPLEELPARMHVLPLEREVVVYCRGPYSPFSDEAVAILKSHGHAARRASAGLPDWRAAGLDVEIG
jgi:rhodanese-related sulfurtransferase/AraC-like DNA-binding protein